MLSLLLSKQLSSIRSTGFCQNIALPLTFLEFSRTELRSHQPTISGYSIPNINFYIKVNISSVSTLIFIFITYPCH
jgi:hypothetical protein